MKKNKLISVITITMLLINHVVSATSIGFDETKAWNNQTWVTYGTHDGSGNADRNFTVKNEYGKVLSYSMVEIFDSTDAKYWIIANDRYGTRAIGASVKYDPTIEGNIAKYVNEAFTQETAWEWNLPKSIISCLDTEHKWMTEKAFSGSEITESYEVEAAVVIPAVWEMEKYGENIMINFLAKYNSNYVFRTAFNDGHCHGLKKDSVTASGDKYKFQLTPLGVGTAARGIRPEFFVNSDFFKTVAVDLSTAGSDVLDEISKYSYDELSLIYSDEDIKEYLPEIEVPEPIATIRIETTDGKAADVGNTVKAIVGGEAVNTQTPIYSWYANDVLLEGATGEELVLTYEHFEKDIVCKISIAGETVASNSIYVGGLFNPATYANMSWVYIGSNDGTGNEAYDFEVDGKSFTLLKTYNNSKSKYLVVANDLYGTHSMGQTTAIYNPAESGSFAEYVNKTVGIYTEDNTNCLPEIVSEHINFEHAWITEKAHEGTAISQPYTFIAGVTVPSVWEMVEFSDRIKVQVGEEYSQYIFRTPFNNTHYHALAVGESERLQLNGERYRWKLTPRNVSGSNAIRPMFCLDEDFFKTEKLNLSNVGEAIKDIIEQECTREELLEIYSEQELIDGGFGANYSFAVDWKDGTGQINSLAGIEKIKAEVQVTSKMSDDKDMVLVMELFDEDKNIVAMDAIALTAKANDTVPAEEILEISNLSDVTENYTLKIFVWNDIISMKALNKNIVFGE